MSIILIVIKNLLYCDVQSIMTEGLLENDFIYSLKKISFLATNFNATKGFVFD